MSDAQALKKLHMKLEMKQAMDSEFAAMVTKLENELKAAEVKLAPTKQAFEYWKHDAERLEMALEAAKKEMPRLPEPEKPKPKPKPVEAAAPPPPASTGGPPPPPPLPFVDFFRIRTAVNS